METQSEGRSRIDRIVYLASLVSDPHDVDATLDKLRAITASSSTFTAEDINVLANIESELEDYLVRKERLRSFTDQSLREITERHFAQESPAASVQKAALRRIALTVVSAAVVTMMLAVSGLMKGQVLLAFFICALFAGLALLFRSIKNDLVAQLHGSVNYLMAATVGTGLFALNFPIIAANEHLEKMPLLQHGGFLIGAIPVYLCYYLAFYFYAKQVGLRMGRLLQPPGAVVIAVAIAAIAALLPHPQPVSHELYFDIAVIGFAVSVYFSGIAALLAFRSIPQTTRHYSRSTRFHAISLTLQTIGNGNFLVFVTFMSGDFSVNEQKGQILTAFLIMMALAFQYMAAYSSRTSLQE